MSVRRLEAPRPVLPSAVWVWLAQQAGRFEYWWRPELRASWGGPFNGQEFRQGLFAELCARVPFGGIVETGTHRGTTTAHMRRVSGLPIHSFESRPRFYGFARAQVASLTGVTLHCCDSRTGLIDLARSRTLPSDALFFYLDAHWTDDPPLLQEIELAFAHWPRAVVMIDDFAVPDDPGYGFDLDVAGRALTVDYLEENSLLPAGVWFPRCASAEETGERRGCVVLARAPEMIERLDALSTLRRCVPACSARTPSPAATNR